MKNLMQPHKVTLPLLYVSSTCLLAAYIIYSCVLAEQAKLHYNYFVEKICETTKKKCNLPCAHCVDVFGQRRAIQNDFPGMS